MANLTIVAAESSQMGESQKESEAVPVLLERMFGELRQMRTEANLTGSHLVSQLAEMKKHLDAQDEKLEAHISDDQLRLRALERSDDRHAIDIANMRQLIETLSKRAQTGAVKTGGIAKIRENAPTIATALLALATAIGALVKVLMMGPPT